MVAFLVAEVWVFTAALGMAIPTAATRGREEEMLLGSRLLVIGDCLILIPVGWVACLSGSRRGRS